MSAALLVAGLAACGSSSSSGASSGQILPLKPGENPAGQQLTGKKKGGTLTVYSSVGPAHFDPGEWYFVVDYAVDYATQRPLFSYMPNNDATVSPDMAAVMPTTSNGGITDGGRTLTVHIRG